jgi:ankyrin repeat protein
MEEIAEVVAIDVDRNPLYNEEEVLEDPMEALDICSSLITISTDVGGGKQDSSRQIAMLAHYSVKEYFLSDRIRAGQASLYSMHHTKCHGILARSCLGYLDLRSSEKLLEEKLANYCAEFWMAHVKQAGETNVKTAQVAVCFLSAENTAYLNWIQIYDPEHPCKRHNPANSLRTVPHPLYYAALFGLANIVELLLERDADANAQGGRFGDALQAAAGLGHERTVKLLIAHGAHVNALKSPYGSAIQAASGGGYEQVMKHLIDAGADVNLQGGFGSALYLAIGNEDVTMVELLLENGADAKLISHDWQTPLHYASPKGHIGIVKLLLEYGADVSVTDHEGWTPVNLASYCGHLDVIRLLLDKGADVSIPNQDGLTALLSAASNGHCGITKLLLEHDKQKSVLDFRSTKGRSALFCAAANGHHKVVKLLLAQGAKVELEDVLGETALIKAATNGRTNVLTLLFAVPGIGPNFKDRYGRTAMYMAAARGHLETVKTLLDKHRCDPNIADNCGRTPLYIATKKGHRTVVDALHADAKVVIRDGDTCATRDFSKQSNLVCDICTIRVAPAEFHYHCHICGNGDWDICAECEDLGMVCLDDTHVLVKRTMRDDDNVWIEVA